jgi:glycosyltransferase involved in cell wall biosynthesis
MDIRDFFVICPTVHLLDIHHRFCKACVDEEACTVCVNRLGNLDPSFIDITRWRLMWGTFLSTLDEIHVYSNYTRELVLKIYGDVIEHDRLCMGQIPIDYIRPVSIREKQQDEPIHVGVLGNVLMHKGLDLLLEMARLADGSQIRLFIIGRIDPRYRHPRIHVVGEYKRHHLPNLVEANEIDVVFVPSIWGETFCRTAEEGILMQIPVACFDLGAPVERVRCYKRGLVISRIDAAVALNEMVRFVDEMRYHSRHARMRHASAQFSAAGGPY